MSWGTLGCGPAWSVLITTDVQDADNSRRGETDEEALGSARAMQCPVACVCFA